MCLAVPMRVIEVIGSEDDMLSPRLGVVEANGVVREVRLDLVDRWPRMGDYLIVHAGFAIHTLDEKEAEANLKLSQARAEAVRDYLIDIHMVEPVRLIPIGYGESQPIDDNGTEAGRAKNRRVDFVVMKD